jgi:hypothetical protein
MDATLKFFQISTQRHTFLTPLVESIGTQVPDEWRQQVQSILIDGLHIMYGSGALRFYVHLQYCEDPINLVINGVRKILDSLAEDCGEKLPPIAVQFASLLLTCEWLDFIEKAGTISITRDFINCVIAKLQDSLADKSYIAVFGMGNPAEITPARSTLH